MIAAVILLPENLFVNTTAPGIIMVIDKAKPHPGEILLINASRLFEKGRPKNYLREEHVAQVHALYRDWRAEEGLSAIISREEAARNDYNLSPSRYVAQNGGEEVLPLEEAVVLLQEAEEERREADAALQEVLRGLGLADNEESTFPATGPARLAKAPAPPAMPPAPAISRVASPTVRSFAPCGLGRPTESASCVAIAPNGRVLPVCPVNRSVTYRSGSVTSCAVFARPSSP